MTWGRRHRALVAQWIEYRPPKAGVAGSNPVEGTYVRRYTYRYGSMANAYTESRAAWGTPIRLLCLFPSGTSA